MRALSIAAVALFCIASDTQWERAGVTGDMVIRGLIERAPAPSSG
jgi:hypothetical protein